MKTTENTMRNIFRMFKKEHPEGARDSNCIPYIQINAFNLSIVSWGSFSGRFCTIFITHPAVSHFRCTIEVDSKVNDYAKNTTKLSECLSGVLREGLENLPLYISDSGGVGAVAAWRLKEGI